MSGSGTVIALDVGEKRIGVASAHLSVGFANPLLTLDDPATFIDDIIKLCVECDAVGLVVGMPRGLNGQDTAQTTFVRLFAARLSDIMKRAGQEIPLYWVDEALTSVKAEAELRSHKKNYVKGDIDALAATYILEDYLSQRPSMHTKEIDAKEQTSHG